MAANALLGFAALTGAHIAVTVADRALQVLGGRKPNTFGSSRDGDTATFIGRVGRSHANCVENLVVFAAVVLGNGVFGSADLDVLARWYLWARIGQSVTHVASVSARAVTVRFSFFVVQLLLLGRMVLLTYQSLPAPKH
eukprot:TRINITY_DN7237_c0_g1_i5.p3 TRINITY_DN7237_c0_g1~~TRINITY_DN7237_c0_g1_i5.p3  ORF type:complete len:162 (+),score=37.44 TRINITY_DN7237_c0_g1_i5:70-486(+)